MENNNFFENWVGRTISFPTPNPPTTWRLEHECASKHDQTLMLDYNTPGLLRGKLGGVYGTFICRNLENLEDVAVTKILMQVPYEGSELSVHVKRAQQGDPNLSHRGRDKLEHLQAMTEADVTSAPRIRYLLRATQDDSGLVPGGFLYCALLEHAPSEELDRETFWARSQTERARIREACKVAWLDGHIFWDAERDKVTIQWREGKWVAWGLAEIPKGYLCTCRLRNPNPDMSEWCL
ncbi:hypothetical protein BDW69DRAFT_203515 [Aspergillus filifer]